MRVLKETIRIGLQKFRSISGFFLTQFSFIRWLTGGKKEVKEVENPQNLYKEALESNNKEIKSWKKPLELDYKNFEV